MQLNQVHHLSKASRDIEKLAIDELNEYKQQVESGSKKFEVLARLYSDDPGSKEKAGAIELSRSEQQILGSRILRHRPSASRRPGVPSRKKQIWLSASSRWGAGMADDALVRHILKIPQITDPEVERDQLQLDSIRTALVNGTTALAEAVARYGDELEKSTARTGNDRNGSTFLTISVSIRTWSSS